jgi:hypothetical protein
MQKATLCRALLVGVVGALAAAAPAAASARPFLNRLDDVRTVSSAVPASGPAQGDVNPYGVAVVRQSIGRLVRGDVLVSNFNNSQNQQGTGSSIVEISPSGTQRVFAIVPPPAGDQAVGLTTALAVLRGGYVVVGNLPAPGGAPANVEPGALSILNANGQVVKTISGGDVDGPWDMTAVQYGDSATLFVTNVLNGITPADAANNTVVDHGTVVRITLRLEPDHVPVVTSNRVIADGFAEHTDPNALVVGPTGVGLGRDGVLYVADSNGNRIAAIPNALTRTTVLRGGGDTVSEGSALNDPLGLTIAQNGDILSVNGGDGNIVETTPGGDQVVVKALINDGTSGQGDLFGIALAPAERGVYFVNDSGNPPAPNSLQILQR